MSGGKSESTELDMWVGEGGSAIKTVQYAKQTVLHLDNKTIAIDDAAFGRVHVDSWKRTWLRSVGLITCLSTFSGLRPDICSTEYYRLSDYLYPLSYVPWFGRELGLFPYLTSWQDQHSLLQWFIFISISNLKPPI